MGKCLVALERHADQRRIVAENPELVPNVIEETLRCYGASHRIVRQAVHDTVLGATELEAGDLIYLLLSAANRDPSRWLDPQRFDVMRPFQPHLGFGVGPHICIAAPLVRLETRVAIETLLRVAPEYTLRELDPGDASLARGPQTGIIENQVQTV
jgi:cytochrome P450